MVLLFSLRQHTPQDSKISLLKRKNVSLKLLRIVENVSFIAPEMLRSAILTESDLTDGLRILILQEGRFWPARLNSTQLPDVYGVVVEKQRGNRPLILPRDDILKEAVSFCFVFQSY